MSGNQPDDKDTAREPTATVQTAQHSDYWYKRYWYWMGRGCKPAEAARRATEDEIPQVHEFRVKKGAKQ